FNRAIYDDANNIVGHAVLGLEIISGPGTGNALREFDGNIQFYCPYALNRLEPKRMLIGTRYIYESSDYGDSLSNLGFVGSVGDGLGNNPISYGGYDRNGTENPGAFFLGAGSDLFYRTADGELLWVELYVRAAGPAPYCSKMYRALGVSPRGDCVRVPRMGSGDLRRRQARQLVSVCAMQRHREKRRLAPLARPGPSPAH